MSDPDIIGQVLGPAGALVATASAAVALWRRHVADDAARETVRVERLADKDRQIEYERAQKAEAEERLDRIGATMSRATAVMERSVDVTEKAIEKLQGPMP